MCGNGMVLLRRPRNYKIKKSVVGIIFKWRSSENKLRTYDAAIYYLELCSRSRLATLEVLYELAVGRSRQNVTPQQHTKHVYIH